MNQPTAPHLGVMYEPDAVSPLRMSVAIPKSWTLTWVIDDDSAVTARAGRMLGRLGSIVDIASRDLDDAAAILGQTGLDGLVSFADSQLVRTAALASRLGLRGHSHETARLLVDKVAQRQALRDAGLPTPAILAVPGDLKLATVGDRLLGASYPAVLKPARGGASRDTSFVSDPDEALAAVVTARARRSDADMVLETFIPGRRPADGQAGNVADYVSVENVVSDGRVSTVAVTGRTRPAEPFRETGSFMPSALTPDEQREVVQCAEAAARALGVRHGCLHTEIKLSPDGPRIIEVNGRVGGGGIPDILERVNGFSLLRAAGQVAVGEPVVVDGPLPCDAVGYFFALQPPMWAHRLVSIDGMADLLERPGVDGVALNKRPDEPLDWRDGSYNYLLTVNGVAADHRDMAATFDAMHTLVTATFG